MKYLDISLGKNEVTKMTIDDLNLLMQLTKIENTLNTWLYILRTQNDDEQTVKNLMRNFELISVCASIIYEAQIQLIRDDGIITDKIAKLDQSTKDKYLIIKDKYKNRKNLNFYQAMEYIRNKLAFHLDKDIYKQFFKEGDSQEDFYLGQVGCIENDDVLEIKEILFTKTYEYVLHNIISIMPKSEPPEKVILWLLQEVRKELFQMIEFVNGVVFSLFDYAIKYNKKDD